jgi:NADPH:quinone reductase-like Zn-dependent oxidoreductase
MKAVVQDRYGPPAVLRIEEVERPVPGDDEVLIRVYASTVTQSDTRVRAANPIFWRLFFGFRRPRWRMLGVELAGVVDLFLKELIEAGELRVVVDRRYPMEQAADAHRYVEAWRKAGNVVLTIAPDSGHPAAR